MMTDDIFNALHGYYLEDLTIGMKALCAKTITDADVTLFAGISGDTNPLHTNEEFASKTRFGHRIAHGYLTTSLWSTLIGTQLPGPGAIYMSQDTKFLRPVFIGATVTATVEIIELNVEKQKVILKDECRVDNKLVATGKSVIWVSKKPE